MNMAEPYETPCTGLMEGSLGGDFCVPRSCWNLAGGRVHVAARNGAPGLRARLQTYKRRIWVRFGGGAAKWMRRSRRYAVSLGAAASDLAIGTSRRELV